MLAIVLLQPPRTSYTVHVYVEVFGGIEIHDRGDIRHIKTSGGDISCHECCQPTLGKGLQCCVSIGRVPVPMKSLKNERRVCLPNELRNRFAIRL